MQTTVCVSTRGYIRNFRLNKYVTWRERCRLNVVFCRIRSHTKSRRRFETLWGRENWVTVAGWVVDVVRFHCVWQLINGSWRIFSQNFSSDGVYIFFNLFKFFRGIIALAVNWIVQLRPLWNLRTFGFFVFIPEICINVMIPEIVVTYYCLHTHYYFWF